MSVNTVPLPYSRVVVQPRPSPTFKLVKRIWCDGKLFSHFAPSGPNMASRKLNLKRRRGCSMDEIRTSRSFGSASTGWALQQHEVRVPSFRVSLKTDRNYDRLLEVRRFYKSLRRKRNGKTLRRPAALRRSLRFAMANTGSARCGRTKADLEGASGARFALQSYRATVSLYRPLRNG